MAVCEAKSGASGFGSPPAIQIVFCLCAGRGQIVTPRQTGGDGAGKGAAGAAPCAGFAQCGEPQGVAAGAQKSIEPDGGKHNFNWVRRAQVVPALGRRSKEVSMASFVWEAPHRGLSISSSPLQGACY